MQNADLSYVLSNKDLSDVKRLFTQGRSVGLQSVGSRLLLVSSSQSTPVAYSVGAFGPADVLLLPGACYGGSNDGAPEPLQVGDNRLSQGVLYSADFSRAILLRSSLDFPAINGPSASAGGFPGEYRAAISLWGTTVMGSAIRRLGGQTVAQLPQGVHAPVVGFPAVVSLPQVVGPGMAPMASRRPGENTVCEMVFRDLASGKVCDRLVLFNEPPRPQYPRDGTPLTGQMHVLRGIIVAVIEDQVFVVRTSGMDARKYHATVLQDAPGGACRPGRRQSGCRLLRARRNG